MGLGKCKAMALDVAGGEQMCRALVEDGLKAPQRADSQCHRGSISRFGALAAIVTVY